MALATVNDKSYTSLHHGKSITKFTKGNPSRSATFLQREGIQNVFQAFLSRRASRNCSKILEEMLLDGAVSKSAIADFFSSFLVLASRSNQKYIYIAKLFDNDRSCS